jgi:hypothetical protein
MICEEQLCMMILPNMRVIAFNAMAVQAPKGYQRRYVTYSTGGCINRSDATLTLGETSSHPNPRHQSHCLHHHQLGLQLAQQPWHRPTLHASSVKLPFGLAVF